MKIILVPIISFLFLAGCTFYKVDSVDTTMDFHPPKETSDKVVYLEKIDRPVKEIGVVTVLTDRTRALKDILTRMKYEAAMLGGDAITDLRTDASGGWGPLKVPRFLQNGCIRAKYSARVVVFP